MINVYEHHRNIYSELPLIFHLDAAEDNFNHVNWHQNIEILYFTKGSGTLLSGVESFDVSSGKIAVINSNILHGFKSDGVLEYYCLIPDSDFFLNMGISTTDIYYTTVISDNTAVDLFKKIISAFHCIDIYRNAYVIVAVTNFLLYISKNHCNQAKNTSSKISNNGILLAIGYISANINKNITIDELCIQANMSKYYFIKEFKKKTGSTPIEFIHIKRCDIAKKMLTSGNYRVSDVSSKTGFESTSYFSKIFKRYVGMTPSEYAKSIKN